MTRYTIWKIIRKLDFSLTSKQVDALADTILTSFKNHSYDFSTATRNIFTQQGKKRVVYEYSSKTSVEAVLIQYLKTCIDDTFKITYASRSRIMNILFNVLPVVKDMNDFVLIRTDFKSFFDSVYTRYVYDKYILPSQGRIDALINSLTSKGNDKSGKNIGDLFIDYLRTNPDQFFIWNINRDFLRNLTFKTRQRTIFKNYQNGLLSLYWSSL